MAPRRCFDRDGCGSRVDPPKQASNRLRTGISTPGPANCFLVEAREAAPGEVPATRDYTTREDVPGGWRGGEEASQGSLSRLSDWLDGPVFVACCSRA
jgi:hypothetical protein